MKKRLTTISLILVFAIGLSLLLYPTVSDIWNSAHQSRIIASYIDAVSNVSSTNYDLILDSATKYNRALQTKPDRWILNEAEREEYESLMNVEGNGVMGYLEIPKIHVSLPIYHGIDEAILQIAVGHMEGSSLPVGGEGTHCVLSGHTGLPSAKLLTNLDQMKEGDLFKIKVLDELLLYEVDQIHIVEPSEMSELEIVKGKDLCTLITCTPYGVNSHRLLVRGHRIKPVQVDKNVRVTADAEKIDITLGITVVTTILMVVLAVGLLLHRYVAKKRRNKDA